MLRNRAHSHTTDTAFMTTEGTKSQIFNALSPEADTSIRLPFPKSKREWLVFNYRQSMDESSMQAIHYWTYF